MALPMIQLGATGFELSRLGLGGFHQLEISTEIVTRVVHAFLAEGGNYIETARGYGNGASEKKLGIALEGRRDEVILCSKSGAETADEIRRDVEETLKNLKTDHIEFYYFHGIPNREKLDKILAKGGALEGLLKAKEEGLIAGMGASSHNPPMYIEAINELPLSLILIWSNYLEDMYLPEISAQIMPHARKNGVGITAMKPLADGFLYRNPADAIRYSLGSGAEVLVCGMNSEEHVHQAADAVRAGAADEKERERILKDAPELGKYVCRQCGDCSADLMELFRHEGYVDRQMVDYLEHDPANYALQLRLKNWFSLGDTGRAAYKAHGWDRNELLKEAGSVTCPFDIDVPRKVRLAVAKLEEEDTNLV